MRYNSIIRPPKDVLLRGNSTEDAKIRASELGITGSWLVDNESRDLNNEFWLVVYLYPKRCQDQGQPTSIESSFSSSSQSLSSLQSLTTNAIQTRNTRNPISNINAMREREVQLHRAGWWYHCTGRRCTTLCVGGISSSIITPNPVFPSLSFHRPLFSHSLFLSFISLFSNLNFLMRVD